METIDLSNEQRVDNKEVVLDYKCQFVVTNTQTCKPDEDDEGEKTLQMVTLVGYLDNKTVSAIYARMKGPILEVRF